MAELHALYRRWLPELWNADPGAMAAIAEEIFAPDAVAHWREGEQCRGPASIAAKVAEGVGLFDDVAVELDHGPIVDGTLVAARRTFRGRFRGGRQDMPAKPGTPVPYPGMDLMRAADGRFVEYWPLGDNLTLMTQLGLIG